MGILSAFFEVVMTVFGFIIDTLFNAIASAVPSRRKTELDADFGHFSPGRSIDIGFRVATWYNGRKAANSHMLIAAGSGGGKSTNVVHNILLQSSPKCAYIVLDTDGYIAAQTSGYLHACGIPIYYFDVEKPYSICLNFIRTAKTLEDLHKNIGVAMANGHEGAKDYWYQSAENLIYFFASILWLYADRQYISIANVINMIQVFSFAPQKLDRWILAHCSEQILTQYKSLCAVPPKTMQCTISTALTTLHIYTTEKVQRITNETNFSLATLRSEGGVLYLTGSPSSAYHYRAVYAILIQNFFNEILHTDVANDDHDLMFLLDEIGNVTIPGLPSFLSLCRKRRCSVATLWQDTIGQIVRNYGKDGATTILANSAVKAFLPGPKPVEVCVMLERLCGKFNFEEDGHVKTRDLLTAQEAYQTKNIILLDNNEPPLLIKPYPFYEDSTLLKRSQIAPYYPDTEDTFSDTVLIDFS